MKCHDLDRNRKHPYRKHLQKFTSDNTFVLWYGPSTWLGAQKQPSNKKNFLSTISGKERDISHLFLTKYPARIGCLRLVIANALSGSETSFHLLVFALCYDPFIKVILAKTPRNNLCDNWLLSEGEIIFLSKENDFICWRKRNFIHNSAPPLSTSVVNDHNLLISDEICFKLDQFTVYFFSTTLFNILVIK